MTKINIDGSQAIIDIIYIRGAQIRFIVLPDMLKRAPFFNRIKVWRKCDGHPNYGATSHKSGMAGVKSQLVRALGGFVPLGAPTPPAGGYGLYPNSRG